MVSDWKQSWVSVVSSGRGRAKQTQTEVNEYPSQGQGKAKGLEEMTMAVCQGAGEREG